MRTCKTSALPAVLALALVAPVSASDAPPKSPDIGQQLQNIANELAGLRREVQILRQDLTDIALRGATTTVDVRALRDRLDALQSTVNRQDETVRRALSFTPQPVPAPPAPAATGSIELRNRSFVPGTFTINGQLYTVEPGTSVMIRMPAGTFTYEIEAEGFGVRRPLTTRVLNPGQTYFLTLGP
jgi:hypothetical protein